jgi:acyl carrier protein phosphodiesterase
MSLPAEAQAAVERMLLDDRLGSYRRLDGIEASLRRVSLRLAARTGQDIGLERGMAELTAHFDGLQSDFAEFFPLLQAYAEGCPEAERKDRPESFAGT